MSIHHPAGLTTLSPKDFPMATKGSTKYRLTALPEFSKAMHEKGRSNSTQPHDSRPNRQRSRRDAKRAAIRNGGW